MLLLCYSIDSIVTRMKDYLIVLKNIRGTVVLDVKFSICMYELTKPNFPFEK